MKLEKVDLERYEYIKSLFAEMGFTGNDLEMRTIRIKNSLHQDS